VSFGFMVVAGGAATMEYAFDSVESFHTRMTGAAAGNAKYEVSAAFKRTFLNAGYAWKDDYTDYVGRATHFEIGAEDFTSHTISSGGPAGLGAAGISYSGDRDAFLFWVTRGQSYHPRHQEGRPSTSPARSPLPSTHRRPPALRRVWPGPDRRNADAP
jgi:hypothetical protein